MDFQNIEANKRKTNINPTKVITNNIQSQYYLYINLNTQTLNFNYFFIGGFPL